MVAAVKPKRIVVFADGTGNAFTTQESNIWRLYQALDQSSPDQIVHYVKGVGTSGFRPFALIDGATGIGVPSNVRKLYEFLCWNWHKGDDVYMFGFSRGAFTVRTLIGLIHYEGLVPTEIGGEPLSRAEMRRNVMAAYRSYREKTIPWKKSLPTIWLVRAARDIFYACYSALMGHRSYASVAQQTRHQNRATIPIKFTGLFDTVEAFGVPIEEFRRAIDWAIWPISFRNHVLSDNVERACHALSLDEERTTFHPLRFDMSHETHRRIQEVWFAGVHSDVGGGYPENELAHVPLVWMADQAMAQTQDAQGVQQNGLRFLEPAIDAFRNLASPFEPCHDSREGLGVFYRYGPRQILDIPVIHHSVAEKMVFGSERYAPKTLPSTAQVLMPDNTTLTIKGFAPDLTMAAKSVRLVREEIQPAMSLAIAAVHALKDTDSYIVSLVRDVIWWRRVAYFALLFSAVLLASLPTTAEFLTDAARIIGTKTSDFVGVGPTWTSSWEALVKIAGGITAFLGSIFALIGNALPSYAKPWTDILLVSPITCAVVAAVFLVLYWSNGALRDRIADLARQAWFPSARERALVEATSHGKLPPKRTLARFMRTSCAVKCFQLAVSNYLLPGLGLILIFAAVAVSVIRASVSYYDGHGDICISGTNSLTVGPGKSVTVPGFSTNNLCWGSGIQLEKGRHYTLWIEMEKDDPFYDGSIKTRIAGFRDKSVRHLVALPILRWWSADWFQPIVKIGRTGDVQWPLESIVGDIARSVGDGFNGVSNDNDIYVSEFVARADGELFLYVNDAIAAIPFWGVIPIFYENNKGHATITVMRTEMPKVP